MVLWISILAMPHYMSHPHRKSRTPVEWWSFHPVLCDPFPPAKTLTDSETERESNLAKWTQIDEISWIWKTNSFSKHCWIMLKQCWIHLRIQWISPMNWKRFPKTRWTSGFFCVHISPNIFSHRVHIVFVFRVHMTFFDILIFGEATSSCWRRRRGTKRPIWPRNCVPSAPRRCLDALPTAPEERSNTVQTCSNSFFSIYIYIVIIAISRYWWLVSYSHL